LVQAQRTWGNALVQAGKIEEAIGHYEQALRAEPDDAETHYNLGIALVQLGRLPEAIRHWEMALHIKPNYAEAHYNLGIALEKQGHTPEAIGHYEQALQANPDFAPARDALARARAASEPQAWAVQAARFAKRTKRGRASCSP
jgi:tetratricopeptide (TPR) repeat protein